MGIEKARDLFTVHRVGSRIIFGDLIDGLERLGYLIDLFKDLDSYSEIYKTHPPHVLLIGAASLLESEDEYIRFTKASPETHVFIFYESEEESNRLAKNIVDTAEGLFKYSDQISFVTKALDLVLTNDYLKHKNEKIEKQMQSTSTGITVVTKSLSLSEEDFLNWVKELCASPGEEKIAYHYIKLLSDINKGVPTLFLKYFENHKTLVVTQSVNVDVKKISGMGIDFKKVRDEEYKKNHLKNPTKIKKIKEMLSNVFPGSYFKLDLVTVDNAIYGISVVALENEKSSYTKSDIHKNIFETVYEKNILRQKLFNLSHLDESTRILNKDSLFGTLEEEVSRARRLKLPVSLLVFGIDKIDEIKKEVSSNEIEYLIKVIIKFMQKNSRVNDIIGRLGLSEFAVVLPHTSIEGASIKAERFRRLVENVPLKDKVDVDVKPTISVGVSEYPSTCSATDELLKTADDSYFESVSMGGNKVCVYTPNENFQPEYEIDS